MAAPQPDKTNQRIAALQAQLKKQGVDGLFLIICMPYEGEQVKGETMLPTDNHIEYLTGFDGSAGMMLVTQNSAALFVDGRYTLAAQRMAAGTSLETHHYAENPWLQWLATTHKGGKTFAADYAYFSDNWVKNSTTKLADLGITLKHIAPNPVDAIWTDKPAPPLKPAEVFAENLAGEGSVAKRKRLGADIAAQGAAAALLTDPMGIAWTLNIRGSDLAIPGSSHLMVVISQLLLTADGKATWFVEPERVPDDVRTHIGDVEVMAPDALASTLAHIKGQVMLTDKDTTSALLQQQLQAAGINARAGLCVAAKAKAIKNTTELDGFRAAHRRDGAAYVKFLRWYDANVAAGDGQTMEAGIVARMDAFRAEANEFRCVSFAALCGYADNGADIHYHTSAATDKPLNGNSLLIFDSGGQYVDGTTDITRVFPVGTPAQEMIDNYTRVLKGHIALAVLKFPAGTSGHRIDAFTRQYLWQAGLDFDHGTGHGVGHFLSVHEGPQRISFVPNTYPLAAGMVVSNEPGYYKSGADGYGIRIENLCAIVPAPDISHERPMLQFETLTVVPLDRRLINADLLTDDEIKWVNDYHTKVWSDVSPTVTGDDLAYLKTATAPL